MNFKSNLYLVGLCINAIVCLYYTIYSLYKKPSVIQYMPLVSIHEA